MTKKALIVIDQTNDFVADDGALTCGKAGQAITPRIAALTKAFVENGNYVVMAVDAHDENDPFHPETKLFPPHNIRGTLGRDLYGELGTVYSRLKDKIKWMDKTRYSAFAGTDLEMRLRERGIQELHFTGVLADCCVLHSVADAYHKNFDIVVHADAVASLNETALNWALNHFKNFLGAALLRDGKEI